MRLERTLCEHVPGPEEIKAWLGSSYNPAHHLTGKVLLTKWPSGKAEGLLKIKKNIQIADICIQLTEGRASICHNRPSRPVGGHGTDKGNRLS